MPVETYRQFMVVTHLNNGETEVSEQLSNLFQQMVELGLELGLLFPN